MKYKLQNWSEYNKSLINRGSITFWFSEDAIEKWLSDSIVKGRGRPFTYSDVAILTSLIIKFVYHLSFRASEGFTRSVMSLMQIDLPVPSYTQVCRRGKMLDVVQRKLSRKRPIDIVIDSTGLKIYGEGEWQVKKHGKSKRRTWRKLHLCVCPTSHEIMAEVITGGNEADCKQMPSLLEKVPKSVRKVYGDGAYDTKQCYEAIRKIGAEPVIPPRKGAVYRGGDGKDERRNRCVLSIKGLGGDEEGRAIWKKLMGYHKRSLAETAMYRMKTLLGPDLKSRHPRSQEVEGWIKCKILNQMTSLGMPRSYAV